MRLWRSTRYLGMLFSLCLYVLAIANIAHARVHYVDPLFQENLIANGSSKAPWQNLQKLFSKNIIRAGDEVVLRSGYYGQLFINAKKYKKVTSISVLDGHDAKFSNLRVWGSQNLYFKGLTVSPSFDKSQKHINIVEIKNKSKNIRIEAFNIFSEIDSAGWNKAEWNEKSVNGIFADGSELEIINNKLTNVNFGISVLATHSRVMRNLVKNFSGDGLRAHGDYTLFEQNTVTNCFQVNDNHADGFQAWTVGNDGRVGTGTIHGVILRRNLIVNYEDHNQPYRCKMQGIGLFDGMFDSWIIENNIVVADHWHGITVLGGKNMRILNNTVFDPDYGRPGPSWIKIGKHKNGTEPTGNLIANNLAGSYDRKTRGVLHLRNQIIYNEKELFVDAASGDFRLRKDSRALGAGMPGLGATVDFYGNPRLSKEKVDVGAVEYQR